MAEHLSDEILARLVDGSADARQRSHLASCPACSAELRALREQTEALSSLPVLRPPRGDWEAVEARLRSEGLVRPRPADADIRGGPGAVPAVSAPRRTLPPAPRWLNLAAALALFLGGGAAGAALTGAEAPEGGTRPGVAAGSEGNGRLASTATVDEAAEAVRVAEERYIEAFLRYRALSGAGGGAGGGDDPEARYAALDALIAASRDAVREAPADPFLNGVLVSSLAERQATLRQISTGEDEWY